MSDPSRGEPELTDAEITSPGLADTEITAVTGIPPVPADDGVVAVRLPSDEPVVRAARGQRYVASAFIVLTAVVAGVAAWQAWQSYRLVLDVYAAAPTVTDAQLDAATHRTTLLSYGWLAGVAVSGIAFLLWLWRARVNSWHLCPLPQRLRIRWAALAWVVPVVNLWLPYVVVADVWRASRPDQPAHVSRLRQVRGSALVGVWWVLFVTMHAVDLVAINLLVKDSSAETFRTAFLATAVSGGLAVVTAVLALVIMRRVDRWQDGREMVR